VYEENVRVNIMKGTADSTSAIQLLARYTSGSSLFLSIDTYWTSVGSWDIGGSFGLSSSESSPGYPGFVTSGVGVGSASNVGYISIVATHRIEHWVYLNPDGTKHDEEYKAYWARFYPSTMNNLKGEDEVSVNYNWITTVCGNGISAPGNPIMFSDGTSTSSSLTVSVPVDKFIQDAARALQFPPLVLADLIFSVSVKYSSTTAMDLIAEFWGQAGYYYYIYRGVSKFGGITAVYYQVKQK
ncbi:MAG: hypothetical protein ACP5HX_10405, partial [Thermoproteota archaeon]